MSKKYYWLKLHNNFFQQSAIKKLRSLENGNLYTLIYLKLQLLSITTDGKLFYKGIEDTFAADLSWEIDETAEDIQEVLALLEKYYLLEIVDEDCLLLTKVAGVIGSEAESTARVRRMRSNNLSQALQCNTDVTKCNTEIELEPELKKEIKKEQELQKELLPDKEPKKENDEINTHTHVIVNLEDKKSLTEGTVSSVSPNSPVTSTLSIKSVAPASRRLKEHTHEEQNTLHEIQLISNRILAQLNKEKSSAINPSALAGTPEILPLENSFEDFWRYYPKVYDRASTFQAWQQTIALGIAATDLIYAAKKYAVQIKDKQTLLCYITSSRNFLLHHKFWQFLPTYLETCPHCKGKGIFSKAKLTGEEEYYTCNCHKRYQNLSRSNVLLPVSA